jgi:hypothetical protein
MYQSALNFVVRDNCYSCLAASANKFRRACRQRRDLPSIDYEPENKRFTVALLSKPPVEPAVADARVSSSS